MPDKEKLILGGLGALIPTICNLLIIDVRNVIGQMDGLGIFGYLLRVIILFALGAFLAYVHKDESDRWKVVQLGLGVPALVVSVLNAGMVAPPKGSGGTPPMATVLSLPFVREAAAQANPSRDPKPFTLKEQTAISKIWHGFTGTPRRHVWFVIADTALTPDEAQHKASELNRRDPSLHAEVYKPYRDGEGYAVVVGRDLEWDEAQELIEKLRSTTGTPTARAVSPVQPKK